MFSFVMQDRSMQTYIIMIEGSGVVKKKIVLQLLTVRYLSFQAYGIDIEFYIPRTLSKNLNHRW